MRLGTLTRRRRARRRAILGSTDNGDPTGAPNDRTTARRAPGRHRADQELRRHPPWRPEHRHSTPTSDPVGIWTIAGHAITYQGTFLRGPPRQGHRTCSGTRAAHAGAGRMLLRADSSISRARTCCGWLQVPLDDGAFARWSVLRSTAARRISALDALRQAHAGDYSGPRPVPCAGTRPGGNGALVELPGLTRAPPAPSGSLFPGRELARRSGHPRRAAAPRTMAPSGQEPPRDPRRCISPPARPASPRRRRRRQPPPPAAQPGTRRRARAARPTRLAQVKASGASKRSPRSEEKPCTWPHRCTLPTYNRPR